MATTTIRVDTDTHARLRELSERSGTTLMETVRAATDALDRARFGARVADEMAALRADPEAWADYTGEIDALPVADGLR